MKIIIPVIVGAVIGYITNWLAIKMLFRPHTQKKIFGVPLPFTPGLIPKEKSRIAKNVGDTVGVHLLSPETVAEALSNQKINEQLKAWIEGKIYSLKHSSKLIKNAIRDLVGDHYEEFLSVVEKRMTKLIISKFRHPDFKKRLLNLIEIEFLNKYNDDNIKDLKNKVQQIIYNFTTSKGTRETIKAIIEGKISNLKVDNRILDEVIPKDLIDTIKAYLHDNSDKIISFMKEMITSPKFQNRITDSVSEHLTQNSKSVMSMFLKADLLSGKIFDVIESYIENENNKEDIIIILTDIIDKLLQSRLSEIVGGISSEDNSYGVNFVTDMVLGYITDKENQDKIINLAENGVKSSKSYVNEKMLDFISQKIDQTLESERLEHYLSLIVHEIFESILNKPVSFAFEGIEESTTIEVFNLAKKVFDNFIRNKAANIVEILNLSRLVENQINNFDVAFAEELIIDIANNELRAITWFGAILGAVLGILSPLIQFLYR